MTKEEIENQIHDFALRINSMGFLDGYSKGLDDRKKEIEKARKEGYDEGVKDGQKGKISELLIDTYTLGLNDAWECAIKIVNSPLSDAKIMEELFNTTLPEDVLPTISASEAIAKIKEYEEKEKENKINIGDEVKIIDPNVLRKGEKGVVTRAVTQAGYVRIMFSDGYENSYQTKSIEKTGKSYPELANVLEQLKGDK